MTEYEQGRKELESIKTDIDENGISQFNEANTRFKYIDRILTKCLGWNTSNISCEDSFDGKYTDYILSLFRTVAVLEAKNAGIYFKLPVGQTKLIQPLATVYKDNKKVRKAIDQVKGYCSDRSIQIAIVSNGWQFVAFIANRNDSIPPLEGNALVVPSIDYFLENYQEIWNCLSKTGFKEEYLLKKLIGQQEIRLPAKLSSTIYNYPGIKNRNSFQTELEILSDLVLEDSIREKDLEKEFLENCYCKSGALSNYSLVSKAILTTRYNYLFDTNSQEATLEQVSGKKGLSQDLVDIFSKSLSKRPVLLVGDVGVGKSTFIDYLRLIEAPKVFENAISIKLNLGEKAIVSLSVRKAILNLIKEELHTEYEIDIEEDNFVRHCYHVELGQFKKSVKVKRLYEINEKKAIKKEISFLSKKVEDAAEHLKKSLEYISKSQRKQIIIFIDNCDQRSDKDQEKAFLIANEFATTWPVIAFISIRPETYHRTKKGDGALSGYHTKAFTIPPPRIDEVIKKRLDFAQKITSGDIALTKLSNTTTFSQLGTLIEILKYSLENNRSLFTFLSNVSNENIRKSIELIKKFLGSGHVDTEKILNIHLEQGRYNIPLHEMLRSVIFGDNIHYSPLNTEIINLYDIRTEKCNDHFILPQLIGILFDQSKNSRNHGFVELPEIYSILQGLGFTATQVDLAVKISYSKGLFEISQKGDRLDIENNHLKIRATNLSMYHFQFLTSFFTYIDSIIVDTPIMKEEYKSKIGDCYKIQDRLERAGVFLEYLDVSWDDSNFDATYFDWKTIKGAIESDIERINKAIK